MSALISVRRCRTVYDERRPFAFSGKINQVKVELKEVGGIF